MVCLNHIHVFKHYKLFISLKYKRLKYLMNMLDSGSELRSTSSVHGVVPKVEGMVCLNHIHVFKHYKLFISLKYKRLKYLMNMLDSGSELRSTSSVHGVVPKVEGMVCLNHIHVFKHYKLFISLKYKRLKYLMNMLDSGSELRPTSHIHVVVPQGRLYGSSR